jgi:hypothetical protein
MPAKRKTDTGSVPRVLAGTAAVTLSRQLPRIIEQHNTSRSGDRAKGVGCPLLPRRLYYRLSAPLARESLIASAICASSTDHPQESIDHVLSPEARSRSLLCYWSSAGSEASGVRCHFLRHGC